MVNSRVVYTSMLGEKARIKYGSLKEPMNNIILPLSEYGSELFSDDQQEEIYQRCISDGKPWQEYPDVVKEVKKWYRAEMKGIRKGEIY